MKELPKEFTGRGEVKNFAFLQLEASDKAYLYQVTDPDGNKHYEVFYKKTGIHPFAKEQTPAIMYPKASSFGVWAFQFTNWQKAKDRFQTMSTFILRRKLAKRGKATIKNGQLDKA